MKKTTSLLLTALLFITVFLTACTSGNNASQSPTPAGDTPAPSASTEATPTVAPATPVSGGIANYGTTLRFKGLFERAFYGGEDDDQVLWFSMESLIKTGDDLKPYPYIASWTESEDHKTFTFTIKKGVKWHNGDELTMEDWKFALETIANKDYQEAGGSRYSNVEMIVGVEEYREGKEKEISGVKIIDPYTMTVTVKEASPNTLDNIWSYPMPKKYFQGVAVKDMINSSQVRKNPIGLGPFKIKKIQPGEFVEFERFDDYWQGKPMLDGIVLKVVDASMATSLLQKGEIDVMTVPASQYLDAQKLSNIQLIKTDELAYSYIGFKLGKWDAKQEKIVLDPNSKFADKRLRKAMYYALDRQALIDKLGNGLGTVLNVPMATVSWAKIPDDQINKYEFSSEKAKQLLDEAGYKDIDGDGLREDPQGKKLTFNFDAMSGAETSELRAQLIMQMWKDVGLNVKLNGSLKDFNSFYDSVKQDDPSVEIFSAAWNMASDPDPSGVWRINDIWNLHRWYSDESERLIKEGISLKAYDQEYRKQVYYDWQKLVNEEVPMLYLNSPTAVTGVNKRVHEVKVNSFTDKADSYKWWIQK